MCVCVCCVCVCVCVRGKIRLSSALIIMEEGIVNSTNNRPQLGSICQVMVVFSFRPPPPSSYPQMTGRVGPCSGKASSTPQQCLQTTQRQAGVIIHTNMSQVVPSL